jgi:hypothetical protein
MDTELMEISEFSTSNRYAPLWVRANAPESEAAIVNPSGTAVRSGSFGGLKQATPRTTTDAARNVATTRFTMVVLWVRLSRAQLSSFARP